MLIQRAVLALLSLFFCASALAQTPPRSDRVFVRDLQGIWINEEFAKTLSTLKSPHAAAKKIPPVVIAIKREGRAYPIVVTDFNKASMQVVLDVEPDGKPSSYRLVIGAEDKPTANSEVKYLYLQGAKNAQGQFDRVRMAEMNFMKGKWADYTRLNGEISPYINRLVIAGKYKDEKGRAWEFTEAGEARWPDKKFDYELSLNDPTAACEYMQTEGTKADADKIRYGYAWKDGKLSILPARVANKKVRCDAKPLAVLTPQ